MLRKMVATMMLAAILVASVPAIAQTIVYQSSVQSITQTIKKLLIETLRPNGVGRFSGLSAYPRQTPNWDCVNDPVSDEDTSYVCLSFSGTQTDLYAIQDPTGSGTIRCITVSLRCRAKSGAPSARTAIRTYRNNYYGPYVALSASYSDYSTSYPTNPSTGLAWTSAEVDSLEIGVGLIIGGRRGSGCCTQVWIIALYS
jgi:hypothetical protein